MPCNRPEVWPAIYTANPEILALDAKGNLTRFAWHLGSLAAAATAGPGIQHAAVLGTDVVSAEKGDGGTWRLVARRNDLSVRNQVTVPEITALATSGLTLYAATRWNLTAYDSNLQELGRVALVAPHGQSMHKEVDDIRISDGHAYLLDDVMMPFWVFRVDVRNPAAMRQLLVQDVSASSTPKLQWLNTTSSTWYVEQNFYGRGGGSRSVVPISLADGTTGKSIAVQGSSYPFLPDDQSPRRQYGYNVLDSTFTLPAWALTGHGNISITQVDVQGETLQRSCMTLAPNASHLLPYADLLVTWGRNQVQVWEAHERVRSRDQSTISVVPEHVWAMPALLPAVVP